ncbi:unnamed protein product [Polarella glacialis]|uniref:Uncharacterized protein n=1 Tax=Polarella glacialis TaxID=89957 RepID=A0A813LP65_POLGL|nr:unnamed protein product [Polarella glacialis]
MRVHVELLKLRTKCAKCGQVGHLVKECTNKADSRGSSSTTSSFSPAAKPGGFAGLSAFAPTGSSASSDFFAVGSENGSATARGYMYPVFLHASAAVSSSFSSVLQSVVCKRRQAKPSDSSSSCDFSGLVTLADEMLVDTAAQDGLIGKPALLRLLDVLRSRGLQARCLQKTGKASGVGGDAKVIGVFTVVSNDVPALLPVSLLRHLKSNIDFEHMAMHIKTAAGAKTMSMSSYPSGHCGVNVTSYDADGWTLPQDATADQRRASHRPAPPSRAFPKARASTLGRWRAVLDKVYAVLDYARLGELLRCWQPLQALPQLAAGSGSTKARLSVSARTSEIANSMGGKPLPPMKSTKKATEDPLTCTHPVASCRIFANGSAKRSVACQLCHSRWESEMAPETPTPDPTAKPASTVKLPLCLCGLTSKRYQVVKEGPTRGRHFFKCQRHVCKMFAWDPQEVEALLKEHMEEKAPQGPQAMTPEQKQKYDVYQEQMRQYLQQQEQQEEDWEEIVMDYEDAAVGYYIRRADDWQFCEGELLPGWRPDAEVRGAFMTTQSFVSETFFEDKEMVIKTSRRRGRAHLEQGPVKEHFPIVEDAAAAGADADDDQPQPAMDSDDEGIQSDEPQEAAGEDEASAEDLTQAEIAHITKLHQNMGHPRQEQTSAVVRNFEPNQTIGVDVVFVDGADPTKPKRPVLNIVDFGTSFQLTTFVEDKKATAVWKAFSQTWLKIFGPSMIMIVDGSKEFASLFVERASAAGMLIYLTGAKSPWQNGKTERHGAIFKMHLQVARETFEPENDEELEIMADECVAAKNRLSKRSGFSPIQRQIGHSPRLPANITSDDILKPELAASAVTSRSLQMQRVAMETFLKCDAQDRMMSQVGGTRHGHPSGRCQSLDLHVGRTLEGVSRTTSPRHELRSSSRGHDVGYQSLRDELYRKAKTTYKDVSGEQAPEADGDGERRFDGADEAQDVQGRAPDADVAEAADAVSERDDGERVPDCGSTGRDVRPRLIPSAGVPQPVPSPLPSEQNTPVLQPSPVNDDEFSDVELAPPDPRPEAPVEETPVEEVLRSISMANRLDGLRGEPMRNPPSTEGRFEPYFQDDGGAYFFYIDDENTGESYLGEIFLSTDEVKENSITDWKAWTASDTKEWTRVEATGAVKLHDVATSRNIRKQLEKEGKLDRIMPSRVVRRMKPGDQPGEPPTEKSRWCVVGHKDPDYMSLERRSPSGSEEELMVVLQAGASHKMPGYVIDLQNAFMQSDKLDRKAGTLYAKPPVGVGLPGVDSEQLIEIKAGVYGLGDASRHWRNSLIPELEKLGYIKSKLAPTTFRLHDDLGKLQGLIVVEIDDLFTVGHGEQKARLDKLSQRFKFGKYRSIHGDPDGASFNGRRIRQKLDYGFEVDMGKFVKERLSTVKFAKGRKSTPGALANANEISQGRDNWKAVEAMHKRPDLNLKIHPIALEDLRLRCISDASYANAQENRSQGSQAVIAYHKDLLDGKNAQCSLLHWHSGKIQQVVNSTLAAETRSLSTAVAQLTWYMCMLEDICHGGFDLKDWRQTLQDRGAQIFVKDIANEQLKQAICIVDAKSLFDHLAREAVGGADKRNAIEIQIIRQNLAEINAGVRWIPHQQMVVDGLTKRSGNLAALYQMLDTGYLQIAEEATEMQKRAIGRAAGVVLALDPLFILVRRRASRGILFIFVIGRDLPGLLRRAQYFQLMSFQLQFSFRLFAVAMYLSSAPVTFDVQFVLVLRRMAAQFLATTKIGADAFFAGMGGETNCLPQAAGIAEGAPDGFGNWQKVCLACQLLVFGNPLRAHELSGLRAGYRGSMFCLNEILAVCVFATAGAPAFDRLVEYIIARPLDIAIRAVSTLWLAFGIWRSWRPWEESEPTLSLSLRREGPGTPRGEALRTGLQKMGVFFVKVGQTAAQRPDIVGDEIAEELKGLQETSKPFSDEVALRTIADDLGHKGPLAPGVLYEGCQDPNGEPLLAELDPKNVASASLGQVYRGRMHGGREVALKVQRPGVREVLGLDWAVAIMFTRFYQFVIGSPNDYGAVVDTVARGVRMELDYHNEAANAEEFACRHAFLPFVSSPGSIPELMAPPGKARVLALDWYPSRAPKELSTVERRAMVEMAVEACVIQLLVTGFVHADPHEGNLRLGDDGRVVFLDFGLMDRVDFGVMESCAVGVQHVLSKDWLKLSSVFQQVRFTPTPMMRNMAYGIKTKPRYEPASNEEFAADFGEMLEQQAGGQSRFGALAITLKKLSERYLMLTPPFVALLCRTFITLEGLLAEDPVLMEEYNVYKVALPFAIQRVLSPRTTNGRAALRSAFLRESRFWIWPIRYCGSPVTPNWTALGQLLAAGSELDEPAQDGACGSDLPDPEATPVEGGKEDNSSKHGSNGREEAAPGFDSLTFSASAGTQRRLLRTTEGAALRRIAYDVDIFNALRSFLVSREAQPVRKAAMLALAARWAAAWRSHGEVRTLRPLGPRCAAAARGWGQWQESQPFPLPPAALWRSRRAWRLVLRRQLRLTLLPPWRLLWRSALLVGQVLPAGSLLLLRSAFAAWREVRAAA